MLERVPDPEIPVLSVVDLGIVREVRSLEPGIEVVITPTYSGCPAMETIRAAIRDALQAEGFEPVQVRTVLDPPWTTDWMSEAGRERLAAYGIAPPAGSAPAVGARKVQWHVRCPHCGSMDTRMVSEFGSTACKALHQCRACLEPFDHFKPI